MGMQSSPAMVPRRAPPTPRFGLVIFDCDGVLVDSERITNQVFADMLNELGAGVMLDYMFEHFVGNSMAQCLILAEQLLGSALPVDFVVQYRARSEIALVAQLQPVAGIDAVLDRIRLPVCVASNGSHDKMRTTLGLTGLLSRFAGRMFSATDVARGKPAPDVFLLAARQNGVLPSACVVVEDTPTGVMAARAAGMTVLGFAGMVSAQRLRIAGADAVFDDMVRLPELIDCYGQQ